MFMKDHFSSIININIKNLSADDIPAEAVGNGRGQEEAAAQHRLNLPCNSPLKFDFY